jgi:imidazolonepropionase-like amidohydrolase
MVGPHSSIVHPGKPSIDHRQNPWPDAQTRLAADTLDAMATTFLLPATLLPDGEQRQLWVSDEGLTTTPIDDAEALPGRFTLPGLVDAHAHLSVGPGFTALDLEQTAANLRAQAVGGVLLVRDLGAPRSVTLDLRPGPRDPDLRAAGRWHAPEGLYYEPLHDPVEPEDLIASALHEISRGASWVKVIADWRTPELSYDAGLLAALVEAVHAVGARVAAHTQWEVVADVVAAGVDSVEHGTRLDLETIAVMVDRGVGWTPTLTAINSPLPPDAPPERVRFRAESRDNVRALLPRAHALGAQILAGTDAAGAIVDEVRWLIDYGLAPVDALRSATTTARTFLGAATLEDGAPADVVTFDADPRDDPEVLARPAAILRNGTRLI